MIASRPSTPVVAAASGSVPLYDVPVIPTLPVHHVAVTASLPSIVLKPFARPHSQSITAFGASASLAPPVVGQPCERPVPGEDECTTAKPSGTHSRTSDASMPGFWNGPNGIGGIGVRGGGSAPTSCFGSQKYCFPSLP